MNKYAAYLTEVLRGSLVNEGVILRDRERLSHTMRVGLRATRK